jgi:quaternary ammonium compound-resistance protein SugE
MDWVILVIAGLFEVGWAVGLKYSEAFTRFWPSVGTAIALAASMILLAVALRTLPASARSAPSCSESPSLVNPPRPLA